MAKLKLLLFAATLALAVPASAQVVVLDTDFGGELLEEDRAALLDAIDQGVERAVPGEALTAQDARDAIGEDLAACRGGDCVIAIGLTVPTAAVVIAEIYAEAQIYDFTVRVLDPNTGTTLATQTGDCTFCAATEAVDALENTAFEAVQAASPLPEPTRGNAPAPEDPLAAIEPELEPETAIGSVPDAQPVDPEPEPEPVGPAFVAGDIAFHISVLPESAEITINGETVGNGSASVDLAPQSLVVTVQGDGYETYTEDVSLTAQMAGPIFLRVVMQPTARANAAVRAPRATSEESFNRRAVGGVMLGTGILATAGGVVLLMMDGNTTCSTGTPDLCEDVWEFTPGGIALTALGGIGIGTGIGLLVGATRGPSNNAAASAPRRDVSFAPLRGGGAVMWQQDF